VNSTRTRGKSTDSNLFKYRNAISINNITRQAIPDIDNSISKTILPPIKITLRLKQFNIMSSIILVLPQYKEGDCGIT